MGTKTWGATWVTTNNILTTMSRLVSFLMFLSLMVMVVAQSYEDSYGSYARKGISYERGAFEREALDAPMTHKTKRAHPYAEECIQQLMEKGECHNRNHCMGPCKSACKEKYGVPV